MKTRISIILLFVSLALLMIYAADVQWGFLPLSPSVRGGGLGGSAVILSIIAFAISLKERSSIVVILLLINGGLIVGGMVAVSSQDSQGTTKGHLQTIFGTMGLGNPSYCTWDRENCYNSKTYCMNSANQQTDHQYKISVVLRVAKFYLPSTMGI